MLKFAHVSLFPFAILEFCIIIELERSAVWNDEIASFGIFEQRNLLAMKLRH